MKSVHRKRQNGLADAPRVEQLKNVRFRSGSVRIGVMRKAVNTVIKERLAAETAQHVAETTE